ncbi:MAG: SRPBCC family protein, partial [Gammaproteobacteria bacterium]
TLQVERSIRIKASPEDVFVLINEFHNWDAWRPWTEKNLVRKIILSVARSVMGTVYEWAGNRDGAAGAWKSMTCRRCPRSSFSLI